MTKDKFFTPEEKIQITDLYKQLYTVSKDVLLPNDDQKVRFYIREAIEKGLLQRDSFNLNPIINDCETALIVAEEIGMNRPSILGIMLSGVVLSGAASVGEIKSDFGEDVANILHGMLRIRDLYTKSATVESENFRSLLVTFAEDLRVILIMIANRVLIMRKIKDTPYVEAQRKVSMEAAYLYAPLAHKLGLYKLKSELEDLSLKYLEHDAYYHIKEKLNETKRSRDAYIANFIGPIEEKLKANVRFTPEMTQSIMDFVNSYLERAKGGVFIGVGLVMLFLSQRWELLIVGIACVVGCFLYTIKFSYLGLGDILVLLFFGIVPVGFTYYVMTGSWTLPLTLAGIGMGLATDNLLMVNNYRDIEQDRQSGKMTIVVRMGKQAALQLYLWLGLVAAMLMMAVEIILFFSEHRSLIGLPFVTIYPVWHISNYRKMRALTGKALNMVLGKTAAGIFLYAVVFAVSLLINATA